MKNVFSILRKKSSVKLHDGRVVEIKPVTLERSGGFIKAMAGVIDFLSSDPSIVELFSTHAKEMMDIVESTTDLQRSDIEKMDGADFLKLFGRVLEINEDFFLRAVSATLDPAN